MKVQASWLQEYIARPIKPRNMAEALERAGIEIEQIIYPNRLDDNIVVGLVKKVVQHPNADRLKIADVSTGKTVIQVVCGAPNVRAGLKAPLVLPGAQLPDGTVISQSSIRGVTSFGMLASPKELALSEEHGGLMELPSDLAPGTRLADIADDDPIIDVTTPANRPDLLSVVGLAREIAAQVKAEVVLPEILTERKQAGEIGIKISDPKLAHRYMLEMLELGKSAQTPDWMAARLLASGVRPRSLVVDVTNFVMLELGQPLHAFDADRVKLPISVRRAKKGESIVTLDGTERKLTTEDIVITDAKAAIAIAGVMGGLTSEIVSQSRRIILESASFDGASVRKTALRHGLRTEASARFERRLPEQLAPLALARASFLLKQLAGAKTIAGPTDELSVWPWIQHVGARAGRLSSRFGQTLTQEQIARDLKRLGFAAEPFDITEEAKKHIGKPYVFGASFKTHGVDAFDCSYLIDYIYSLIGLNVGHTAAQIFEKGRPIKLDDLRPGDVLFRGGPWVRLNEKERQGVSHSALYIGNRRIIHAKDYERDAAGEWRELPVEKRQVVMEPVETLTMDPQFIGARRLTDGLDDYVAVTAPWWRPDVKTEADVLEEVARIEGYEALPATLPAWHPKEVRFDSRLDDILSVKQWLAGLGWFEVVTYSFISRDSLSRFGYEPSEHLKLANPMSHEQEYLRRELLPSLVETAARNAALKRNFGLFEVSRVYEPKASHKEQPDEPTHVAAVVRNDSDGYLAAKQLLVVLERELNLSLTVRPKTRPGLSPARSGAVMLGNRRVGWLGEVHPSITAGLKLGESVGYVEVDLDRLLAKSTSKQFKPFSRFPAARRDISLVVKETTTWQEVAEAISRQKLAESAFLSEWRGEGIPSGHKSLAIGLTMSSMDKTLTDQEAQSRVDQILLNLKKLFGAELRA